MQIKSLAAHNIFRPIQDQMDLSHVASCPDHSGFISQRFFSTAAR